MNAYETQLSDLRVDDSVRAFHPLTLGVTYHGRVTKIGRKYVTVQFPITGERAFRMLPRYVCEVV